jgi:tetratricopeptide (TPR) repeat protein
MKNGRTIFLAGVMLVLAAVAAYRNSLDTPFLFDDSLAIVANPSIRHLWPPGEALSPPTDGSGVSGRPLVNLSLAVNYAFGGLQVRGYHVMNLVLHLLASLVLWGVLRRTWRLVSAGSELARAQNKPGPEDAELLAWSAALLWAVHPLLTESVVCVVQRNEVMGGLFYLLTLYGFIRSATGTSGNLAESTEPRREKTVAAVPPTRLAVVKWQVFTVASCLLGVASKEIVATAPLLVLLYDRTFVAGTVRGAWQKRKRFYGALAATWLLLAWLMWHNRQRGGTVGFGLGVSSWDYLLTQCYALVLYLKLSFWPHPLILDYGSEVVRYVGEVWLQGVAVVSLLFATLFALWRRPVLGFVGACFFVILAPSSSFVPLTTQTIAEHRMYLPLAAVIVLAVAGLHAVAGRRAAVISLILAVLLGVRTANRNAVYQDELAVWADALAERPANPRAESGVGTAYYHRGNMPEAVRHFERTLQQDPWSAVAHYNLGLALDKLDRRDEALAHYRDALKLRPEFAPGQAVLGGLLVKLGRPEEAVGHLRSALVLMPNDVEALDRLGQALAGTGKFPEAVATYERALAIDPTLAVAHFNFGLLLAASGRPADAIAHYTEAARLDANFAAARLNLGILLAQAGRPDEALLQLREAVRLQPGQAEAHASLGNVLAMAGRPAEAIDCYEAALRLRPEYAAAHYNLGQALVQQRRWTEARRHFAEAVRIKPDLAAAQEMLERLRTVPEDR